MATRELTGDSLEQVVTTNDIVLVDFWAEWCGPCQAFAPIFEAASTEHPDIVFGKVDTETERELAAAARIMAIPTLMAFRDGVLLHTQSGALPAPALEELIEALRAVDMEKVHAELAAQAAGEDAEGVVADELAAAAADGVENSD